MSPQQVGDIAVPHGVLRELENVLERALILARSDTLGPELLPPQMAGLAAGLRREPAARFSFLMSLPITAAAVVMKGPEALQTEGVTMPLLVGVVAAAVSSWLAITVQLRYVSKHSFGIFALYRLLLAAGVLATVAARA